MEWIINFHSEKNFRFFSELTFLFVFSTMFLIDDSCLPISTQAAIRSKKKTIIILANDNNNDNVDFNDPSGRPNGKQ